MISAETDNLRIIDPKALDEAKWNKVALERYFRGDFATARQAWEKALKVNPEYYTAYYNIADMLEPEEAKPWIERARRLRPKSNRDAAAIAYMIGQLHDLRGEHKAAARAWAEGGARLRKTFDKPFDAAAHDRLVNGFISLFDSARSAALRTAESGGPALIFVVGMPRSGSTLTSRLLASDPTLRDLGESRAFPGALIAELERLGGGKRAPLDAIDKGAVEGMRRRYRISLPEDAVVCLDKYPENAMFLGLVHAAFPEAKIIHTRRDPYDTMLSCYSKYFTSGNAWSCDPADIRAYYDAHERVMAHWFDALPADVLIDSDYDDLTGDPEAAVARLSTHCGLNARHDAAPSDGVVRTASAKQVREGVQPRDRDRYAGYREHIRF